MNWVLNGSSAVAADVRVRCSRTTATHSIRWEFLGWMTISASAFYCHLYHVSLLSLFPSFIFAALWCIAAVLASGGHLDVHVEIIAPIHKAFKLNDSQSIYIVGVWLVLFINIISKYIRYAQFISCMHAWIMIDRLHSSNNCQIYNFGFFFIKWLDNWLSIWFKVHFCSSCSRNMMAFVIRLCGLTTRCASRQTTATYIWFHIMFVIDGRSCLVISVILRMYQSTERFISFYDFFFDIINTLHVVICSRQDLVLVWRSSKSTDRHGCEWKFSHRKKNIHWQIRMRWCKRTVIDNNEEKKKYDFILMKRFFCFHCKCLYML